MTLPVLEPVETSSPTPDRILLGVAAALSAGAGVVHLGLAGEHADHHWTMGAAFLATGWAQLAWPVAAWLRPRGPVLLAGAVLHLAALAGLALVTMAGWPFGPAAGRPEELSTAALLCACLELAAVLAVFSLLRGRVRLPASALPAAVAVVLAAASTAVMTDNHGSTGDDHMTPVLAAQAHGAPGHDAPAAAAAAAPAPAGASGGHGHGPADTTPPTAEQRRAADALLASSRAAMKRYELASVAEAEGYRVVHDAGGKLLHYAHDGYRGDDRTVDPKRMESLLYVVLPGGGKLLVGGMYMVPRGERGPAVGGSLTPWHAHDDLCLDPGKGIAISQLPGGGCPKGSAVGATGEMMHVWAIDYPGGPFGELDAGALRTAVRDHYGLGEQTG